jgi:hypothetical protein
MKNFIVVFVVNFSSPFVFTLSRHKKNREIYILHAQTTRVRENDNRKKLKKFQFVWVCVCETRFLTFCVSSSFFLSFCMLIARIRWPQNDTCIVIVVGCCCCCCSNYRYEMSLCMSVLSHKTYQILSFHSSFFPSTCVCVCERVNEFPYYFF